MLGVWGDILACKAAVMSSIVVACFKSCRAFPVSSQLASCFNKLLRSWGLACNISVKLTTTVTEFLAPLGLLQIPMDGVVVVWIS